MIHKHHGCRVLAINEEQLPGLRRVLDYAISAYECDVGRRPRPARNLVQSVEEIDADLRLLDELRMAIHEDY